MTQRSIDRLQPRLFRCQQPRRKGATVDLLEYSESRDARR